MKNRTELLKYFAELGFTKGAEIGVANGVFSRRMLEIIPHLNLLCIDSWSEKRRPHAFENATTLLKPYSGAMIIKSKSMDAVKMIPDLWLDFVYIDADHTYESVVSDVSEWTKKVRSNGIIAGHDYYVTKTGNIGVIQAVDEYVKENGYELKLTSWDKRNPIKDDRQPSWYFTKK
ncbi:MAG TPA: class I SAM-dependent methyltransferase [Patescibacteria group bacterium]|nr:class I SAM-dependent methyltransferase [Patescibacteria group bacterium]